MFASVIAVLIWHKRMCEKSYLGVWQRARRHMSQDDFTYVLYPRVPQAEQTKTDRERWLAWTRTNNNPWMTVNLPEPWIFMSHLRKELLYFLCAYFCMWADIYSLFTLPPPPLYISHQLLPCLSVQICHRHPAQPGGQEHPAFSHSTMPTPAGWHRSQEASLLIRDLIECVCVCVFCLLHVWSFSSL